MQYAVSQQALADRLLREVAERSGQDVADCYQCGKCTAGCPMVPFMDLMPNQVPRLLQLGNLTVLEKKSIWLCVSCETCVTRCPREIDLPRIMDVLRQIIYERANEAEVSLGNLIRRACQESWRGLKEGLQISTPYAQQVFGTTFLENVRRFGRSFETGLIGSFNLNVGSLFGNVDKGPEMLIKGKMKMLPEPVPGLAAVEELFAKIEEITGREL